MKCAVLGDPIAHSLSPALHRAGYAAVGLDWEYDAHRVPAGGLRDFLAGLDDQWRGLSLTMPLKREVLTLATEVTDRARLAGAANTVVLVDGEVRADNSDLPGAVSAVRDRYRGPVTEVTVLGGGATAASTALALCDLGARTVHLLVRSVERAAETAEAIRRHPSRPEVLVGDLGTARVAGEVLVSTIPANVQHPELVSRLARVPVVFEVVYDPWPTPLALAAEGTLVTGLDLLVGQAVVQFEAFTGLPAPVEEMRQAGEAVLLTRRVDG